MLRKRGQSTLEYVIIVSAIVVAFLAGRQLIQTAINQGITDATTSITSATGSLRRADIKGR